MKLDRTQYFPVSTPPKHPGRYLYKMEGFSRPVMRWFNGRNWQLNRRKSIAVSVKPTDMWAGSVQLHPEVEKMISHGLASTDKQVIKIADYIESLPSKTRKASTAAAA